MVVAYFSSNESLAAFEGFLGEVGAVIERSRPNSVIVLGDFNVKSVLWDQSSRQSFG